ncbi:MAG TPA: hypothetical protein VNO26_10055 [Candidatus Limnocylindria bacterium]|nr:hypothetical protein [Candidatus Limnocylindria bacterium]
MSGEASRLVRWAPSVVVAATALHFWVRNLADPDLWGHLTWGRLMIRNRALPRTDTFSYTAAGQPFFDHEWLSDVLTAATFDLAGAAGLIALKLALLTLMLVCMLDAVRTLAGECEFRAGVHDATTAAGLVLALAVIAPGATFRPQLFTMAFLALFVALLARADRRLRTRGARAAVGWELLCLPPLVAAWANLHGGFLVGVALVGLHAASTLLRVLSRVPYAPSTRDAALVLALAGACALAPLANPYGIELYRYLFATLNDHAGVGEWDPVPLGGLAFVRFKVLAAATAIVGVYLWETERAVERRHTLGWLAVFALLACGYAFKHQRHTVLFAVVAAPVVILGAERLRVRLVQKWPALAPRPAVATAAAAGALVVAAVQIGGVAWDLGRHGTRIRYARHAYPADALAFLERHDFRGNVLLPLQWGSYTVHHAADRLRVFIDGRFEAVYPRQVLDDYFAFVRGGEGSERALDAYPTDIVLLQRAHGIHPRLFARDDFVYVYSDPGALVFVRRNSTNRAALARLTRVARRPVLPAADTFFP